MNSNLTKPTQQHLAWAECELGVIIHLDLQVFEPGYEFRQAWGYTPSPAVFNPESLDTDQWVETAKAAGAKYAVLVAKHCSGFSLWPTKAHDYSVKSSPWKDGKGDVVGDFFKSCKKFGLKPGLYCSAACNAHFNVDNPGRVRDRNPEAQARYNRIVETQLEELWSNYGEVFEIWFDGGVLPESKGGPSIIPILKRCQPNALVLGGPAEWPALLRTIGNERGEAPEPCWSTTDSLHGEDDGTILCPRPGVPGGSLWVAGESDLPNRDQNRAFQGGWFWREGDDKFLYSLEHLAERYFTSVGRNTNMLIGMVIDNRGLVPEADQQRFKEFGDCIAKIQSCRIASAHGEGNAVGLSLPGSHGANMLCLMEEISKGERVRSFVVEELSGGSWTEIWRGSSIGYKHIERFEPLQGGELRVRILESDGTPLIKDFSAWRIPEGVPSCSLDLAKRSSLTITRSLEGLVSISCDNPYLSIRYTLDGSEPKPGSAVYSQPFPLPDGGEVKAAAFLNMRSQSETFSSVFGCARDKWRVVSVSLESPYANGGAADAKHLLSDDPSTYWHSYHDNKKLSRAPHEVILEMDKERTLSALTLLPGACGGLSADAPEDYEFLLSLDGVTWTSAASGSFSDIKKNPCMKIAALKQPMKARFIRFIARRAVEGCDYVKIAGVGAIEASSCT